MRLCSVEGCGRTQYCKGYCRRHYQQYKIHGKILERTRIDPNEFIIDGDICWIILYNKHCIEIARTCIDTKYYEAIFESKAKWHLTDSGYVIAHFDDEIQRQKFRLHHIIMYLSRQEQIPAEYDVDHKDGNPLNNLENNLRLCTQSQNNQNQRKRKDNTSGGKGVTWDKTHKKWAVKVTANYKCLFQQYFDDKEEAIRAYNAAAIQHFGEFAQLNDI